MRARIIGCTCFLLLCPVALAAVSFAQTGQASPNPKTENAGAAQPDSKPKTENAAGTQPNSRPETETQILYTGRLLGYFRVPYWQPPKAGDECPDATDAKAAGAVSAFFTIRRQNGSAILVGTGDNFAPELEARVFCTSPLKSSPNPTPTPNMNLGPNPNPNPSTRPSPNPYQPLNKELYVWDKVSNWISINKLREKEKEKLSGVIAKGFGTIPMDNVGCFLRAAGYAAVVPGKHDFYFGPERLRELARFLAEPDQKECRATGLKDLGAHAYQPVQMLAANLVIKTTWLKGHEPLPDKADPPIFAPRWPGKLSVSNLQDGKQVYPWFPAVRVKLAELSKEGKLLEQITKWFREKTGYATEKEFLDFLRGMPFGTESAASEDRQELSDLLTSALLFASDRVGVCPSWKDGDPNRISTHDLACRWLDKAGNKREVRLSDNVVEYTLPLPAEPLPSDKAKAVKDGHFSTVLPGKNYGLCLVGPHQNADGSIADDKADDKLDYCLRFSVYKPFFAHPSEVPSGPINYEKDYTDPDPYVFLKESYGAGREVAIFGVVDTNLGQYVGSLNFAWRNTQPPNPKANSATAPVAVTSSNYKTFAEAEDPAEALREQIDYFERKYYAEYNRRYDGIKILLAQMSPQRAQVLAARLPRFDVVVSAADQEQATTDNTLTADFGAPLVARPRTNGVGDTAPPPLAFLAVPNPSFDTKEHGVAVHVGSITLKRKTEGSWHLSLGLDQSKPEKSTQIGAGETKNPTEQTKTMSTPTPPGHTEPLDQLVVKALQRCMPKSQRDVVLKDASMPRWQEERLNEQLKLLTLCAMRNESAADVAIIQKRDFFSLTKPQIENEQGLDVQRLLDRAIWKGDFLTLMYVPGSALQKAMDQSKKYDQDQATSLSLSDEKDRGLIQLGISYDQDRKEYMVNQVPLDPARLYAVATTDYIGAGDTGYPDLAAAAVDVVTQPSPAPRSSSGPGTAWPTLAPRWPDTVNATLQARPAPKSSNASGVSTQPGQFPDALDTISSIVCRKLYDDRGEQKCNCLGHIATKDAYFDESSDKPTDTRTGDGTGHRLWAWLPFSHPGPVPGSEELEAEKRKTTSAAADRMAQERGIWDLTLQDLGLSISSLTNNLTDAQINQKFAGITTPSVNAHRSHTWELQLQAILSHSSPRGQFFVSPGLNYNTQYTGDLPATRQINQIANIFNLDTGWIFMPTRKMPHPDLVASFHFETPIAGTLNVFPLNGGANGQVQITQRSFTLLPRLGGRWQNRFSYVEVGGQAGEQLYALRGYRFSTNIPGMTVTCLPEVDESISACVNENSTPPRNPKKNRPFIPENPNVRVLRETRARAGIYWKANLSLPFLPKVSYVWNDQGSFFFSDLVARDNPTDSRFFDISKHQLRFSVWPSLSFGPAFQMLLFENMVNRDFLVQKQFMFEMDLGFDLFNWRNKRKELKYRPSASVQ